VHHLGYFEDEVAAARAYDAAVLSLRGATAPTNFCPSEYGYPPRAPPAPGAGKRRSRAGAAKRARAATSVGAKAFSPRPADDDSRYLGVSRAPDGASWVAEIWDGARFALLGTFATEEGAARSYDAACAREHGADANLNFPRRSGGGEGGGDGAGSEDEDEMSAVEALASISVDVEEGSDGDDEGDDAGGSVATGAPPPAAAPVPPALASAAAPDGASPRESCAAYGAVAPAAGLDRAESVATSPLRPARPVTAATAAALAPAPPAAAATPDAASDDDFAGVDADAEAAAAALAGMLALPPPPARLAPAPPRRRPASASAPPTAKSSSYKGVSWHKHSQKWYAYIQAGGKMRGLGYYAAPADAARAYDREARRVHGVRALLNFPRAELGELGVREGASGGGDARARAPPPPPPPAATDDGDAVVAPSTDAAARRPPRPRPPSAVSWSADAAAAGVGADGAAPAAPAATAATAPPAPPARTTPSAGSTGTAGTGPVAKKGRVGARYSPFRGVSWHKHRRMWQVYVHVSSAARASYHLGYFASEADAARAYDREIVKVRGVGAATNFPVSDYVDASGAWLVPPADGAAPGSGAPASGRAASSAGGGGGGGGAVAAPDAAAAPPSYPGRKRSRKPSLVYTTAGDGPAAYGRARGASDDTTGDRAPPARARAGTPRDDGATSDAPAPVSGRRVRKLSTKASEAAEAATVAAAAEKARKAVPPAAGAATTPSSTPTLPARTRYRGTTWLERERKWLARVWDGARQVTVGRYEREVDAARAHDRAALALRGPAAVLNFPRKEPGAAAAARAAAAAPPARGAPRAAGARATSRFRGVSWNVACAKWVAVLWDRAAKKARHVGSFDDEVEAARAYDAEAWRRHGAAAVLNFGVPPGASIAAGAGAALAAAVEAAAEAAAEADAAAVLEPGAPRSAPTPPPPPPPSASLPLPPPPPRLTTSQYRGVSKHERSGRWEVRLWLGGRQNFVGAFAGEADAARAYDAALLRHADAGDVADPKLRARLNFPGALDEWLASGAGAALAAAAAAARAAGAPDATAPSASPSSRARPRAGRFVRSPPPGASPGRGRGPGLGGPPPQSSAFRGVSVNKSSGRFEARLHDRGRNHYIGSFDAEADAAAAYDLAALALRGAGAAINHDAARYAQADVDAARARLAPVLAAGVAAAAAAAASRAFGGFGGGGEAAAAPPPPTRPASAAPTPATPASGGGDAMAVDGGAAVGLKREAAAAPAGAPSPKRAAGVDAGLALPPRPLPAAVGAMPPTGIGPESLGSAQTQVSLAAGAAAVDPAAPAVELPAPTAAP